MNSQYPDLISLISQNREAMSYFKTLPDQIKCELSKKAQQVDSIERLKKLAEGMKEESNG